MKQGVAEYTWFSSLKEERLMILLQALCLLFEKMKYILRDEEPKFIIFSSTRLWVYHVCLIINIKHPAGVRGGYELSSC